MYEGLDTCPEELLLWFHHVPWDHVMHSGRTLWEELCWHYNNGVRQVQHYIEVWSGMKPYVSAARYKEVEALLQENLKVACEWRDTCIQYFLTKKGA